MPETIRFERESDLCAAFMAAAAREQRGWVFYPETEGWDILAIRPDGVQVGIEAKLRLNNKVVAQAIPDWYERGDTGPDFRAVLVPSVSCENGLQRICEALGITIISLSKKDGWGKEWFSYSPWLPDSRGGLSHWHEWAPTKRHAIPDYIPDVTAGASAPVQLTTWKVQAIKIAILLEERPISRADFKAAGIDPGRWVAPQCGWLTRTDSGYVPGKHMPDFRLQHPVNYEQIKVDRAKWDWTPKTLLTGALS